MQRSGHESMKRMVWKCCLVFAIVLAAMPLPTRAAPASSDASAANAQNATVHERLAQLDQRVAAAQSAGDNAWMLVSAALVLMMTGPGLALFSGGLVSRKNTPRLMRYSFMRTGLISASSGLGRYRPAVC